MRSAPTMTVFAVAAGLFSLAPAASAQATLTPDDYRKWESLGAFQLDPTGTWLATAIQRTDESVEVRVRRADATGRTMVLEHATGPEFARSGRWLAYLKGVAPAEAEASDEPVRNRLGLVDLSSPKDTTLREAKSFAFSDDGQWLAVLGYPLADTIGADLTVLEPATGRSTPLGNVDSFAWQDGGALLAMTLRTASGSGNAVVLFDPESGIMRTLDARNGRYRALAWRDESHELAVMRSVEQEGREGESHDVLVWSDVTTAAAPQVLRAQGRADLADTLRITEHAGVGFGDAGRTLFVGLRPWTPGGESTEESAQSDSTATEEADAADVETADVQIWHWNDDDLIRAQEVAADRNERRTLLAAWHLGDDRLVVLGQDLEEPVELVAGGAWGLVPDYTPYHVQRRFGDDIADWYRVDPATGERAQLGMQVRGGVRTGPAARVGLLYEDGHWVAITLATLERRVLGAGADVEFTMPLDAYDYPGPRPTWGTGGFDQGETAAFFYDEHDVWRADLGSGELARLTRGAEEGREYRLVDPDPEARRFGRDVTALDPADLWFSVRDLTTKASGYAHLSGSGAPRTLLLEDALVTGLRRAQDAQRYAVRKERWDDSPDVFAGGASLSGLRQVTETNPFQGDYAWGHAELLSYTTDAGHDLQAILVYPADYQEDRTYPLILYQYERLSDRLHRYYAPSERSYYNFQVWSQQGYFVLMPDIVYEPGRPGPSALDAVEHALDAAVATGHVDPERMGLIGHSWGGYQAAYLPTRTNRFAAVVAGAAITDFVSFAGNIHWGPGIPEFSHWETGQARMAVPPWQDPEGHLESSPVNFIDQLQTPVLLMHGDSDGTVDFRQGQEYYNYARRAGKRVAMLVYPGADHGLRVEAQQVDYHRRILQWFGYWLKGEEPAGWITDGESWSERARRLKR
jgi:dienelactone hydrolase